MVDWTHFSNKLSFLTLPLVLGVTCRESGLGVACWGSGLGVACGGSGLGVACGGSSLGVMCGRGGLGLDMHVECEGCREVESLVPVLFVRVR